MNQVLLSGRLAADPKVFQNGDRKVVKIRLAIEREVAKNPESGKRPVDWISATAFARPAEFLAQYARQGDYIELVGRMASSQYQRDGATIYAEGVIANRVKIVTSPRGRNAAEAPVAAGVAAGNGDAPETSDAAQEDVPF